MARSPLQVARDLGATQDGDRWVLDGAPWVYVRGGWLRKGLTPDDVLELRRARRSTPGPNSHWTSVIQSARPTRWTWIGPLLVAARLGAPTGRARLPTEAELEWIVSAGGTTRWVGTRGPLTPKNRGTVLLALEEPFGLEQVLDTIHESGERFEDGRPICRECHSTWQDADEELIGLHVSCRTAAHGQQRAVIPLGDPSPAGAPPERDAASELIAAYEAGGKERALAREALALLATSPAEDLRPLVEQVVDELRAARGSPAGRASDLLWLGDLTRAGFAIEADLSACLSDRSSAVRLAAAVPLSFTHPEALQDRFVAETDPAVAASLLLGAARGWITPPEHARLERKLSGARAFVTALLDPEACDPAALVEAATDPALDRSPFFPGGPAPVALQLMQRAGRSIGEHANKLLALGPASGPQASRHASAIARAVFGPLARGGRVLRPDQLGKPELQLLRRLTKRFPHVELPGRRRSPLFETLVHRKRSASGSAFVREVNLDGETLPLYYAVHEIAAGAREGKVGDPGATVAALVGGSLESVVAHTDDAIEYGNGDLVRCKAPAWPFEAGSLLRHVRSADPTQRAAYAATLQKRLRVGDPKEPSWKRDLARLAAATKPPATLPEDVLAKVTSLNDLRAFQREDSSWALDTLGAGWLESFLVEHARTLGSALLAGDRTAWTPFMGPKPQLLLTLDLRGPAVAAALVVLDLGGAARFSPCMYEERRDLFDVLPASASKLFPRGLPGWRGPLKPKQRDPALRDLMAALDSRPE